MEFFFIVALYVIAVVVLLVFGMGIAEDDEWDTPSS